MIIIIMFNKAYVEPLLRCSPLMLEMQLLIVLSIDRNTALGLSGLLIYIGGALAPAVASLVCLLLI